MSIDWGTLAAIAVVAAAAALAVVLLVAFALVAVSGPAGPQDDGAGPPVRTVAGTAVAALCLLAAGLVVCFGLYLIIA